MGTRGRALAVVVLAVACGAARAEERAPRGLAGVGLTQEQVDAAIARGRDLLVEKVARRWPRPEKGRIGRDDLLVALALSHTDAFKRDPKLGALAIEHLYRARLGATYETAVVILALEHLGGDRHAALIEQAARALVEHQRVLVKKAQPSLGGWRYGREAKEPPGLAVPVLEVEDPVIEVSGGVALVGTGTTTVERRGPPADGDADNSCAQFALLGLQSAATVGVVASRTVFEDALEYFSRNQLPDGGWAYQPRDASAYGSMTCAGISGLAIALARTGVADVGSDARVRKGVEWLARNWTLDANPGLKNPKKHLYYYLYGLERVGVLLGTELLGDHEWYPEGARHLLAKQEKDGRWHGSDEGWVRDTCYALLFLTRATTPLGFLKGGQGTLATAVDAPPDDPRRAQALLFVLDASGSMKEKVGERSRWEIVREASKKLVAELPEEMLVGLRVYGHNPSNPKKVDERETELLIPIGKLDKERFAKVVDEITPIGRTPIAMSFDRCARDLAGAPRTRVLLLSDGAETGGGDPVASARALAAHPSVVAIDCLGFDLAAEPKARAQLMGIALVGRGKFVETVDPEVLVREGARANPGYVVLDAGGAEVAKGRLGDSRALPEGHYRIRVVVDKAPHEATFWVNTGGETRVRVRPERARK